MRKESNQITAHNARWPSQFRFAVNAFCSGGCEFCRQVSPCVTMKSYQTSLPMFAAFTLFAVVCVVAAWADDRTMRISVQRLEGSPPATAVIGVSAGNATNPNPSSICFHVEYSDDLTNWMPLHSFDLSGTNTQATVVCTMTYDLTVLFLDVQAGRSQHRYYRAVEDAQ